MTWIQILIVTVAGLFLGVFVLGFMMWLCGSDTGDYEPMSPDEE